MMARSGEGRSLVRVATSSRPVAYIAAALDRGTFRCLDYSADSTDVPHSSSATASASVTGLTGTFASDLVGVSSTDTHININGTPPPACSAL
jgi:hypothetical protein